MNILKNIKFKIFLTIVLLIVLFLMGIKFFAIDKDSSGIPKIINGNLDLSNWNSDSHGLINLNGKWEFFWQKFFSYNSLSDGSHKPDIMAEVPKVWNSYKINGKNLPGFGFATYRLKIKNMDISKKIAVRMPTVSTAFSLYVNDKLLASNGRVGMDRQHYSPQYRPVKVEFMPPSQDFDIIIQAANFSYDRGGAWYPVYMGSVEGIAEYDRNIAYKDLFLIGAFLIMALYYLSIFFMHREDKSSLYFVFLCLNAIGRTAIYGDYSINRIFPWVDYYIIVVIDHITLYWFPVAFALLIGELFPEQVSRKLLRVFVVYASGMSLFTMLSPVYIFTFTSLTYLNQAVALAIAFYAVICAARAFPKAKGDSAIIMAGASASTLGGVHDVLYHNNIILTSFGELSSFGFLILLFLQSFILARRFAKAFNDARTMSEKLVKLDGLKNEFLANTSHELRTPLNAMINIADGISRGTEGPLNENQKASLSMITASGKRLSNLINDILDYSKLKNLDLKMNLEAVSLKRVVENVMNVLGRLNKTEYVQMLIDIPNDLPNIYADENRLLQILYNLVGNALKFTETGYIKVSAAKVADIVEIFVEDTGIGIPEDKLGIIFESFQQLEASLTRRNVGAGLGLSITKYLIEAHNGNIRVESKVGIGSKFYFSIPASTEVAKEKSWPNEIAEAEYSEKYIQKFPYRKKADGPHIMVVDDNKANLMSVVGILKMNNYSVTAVTSSREFFEEFKAAEDVSLVILDVMLPELSGYEICREIRKSFSVSELPVLMLTARTTTHDIVTGMESGANDYLAKPFDTEELLARVRTLVQLKTSVDKAIVAEMAFLQAQIKPHFLYNALNTIISISRSDIKNARNLLIDFSDYLRKSFDFKDLSQFIPLKNELDLAKAYVEIEKARFEERLEVNFKLLGNLEVRVPVLMIQPLIENAIMHGILPQPEGGRVDVVIKKVEKSVLAIIKDNGIGMDEAKLKEILLDDQKKGVGLANIERRLKKFSGKGLEIKSKPGEGTEVILNIPIRDKEDRPEYDQSCFN